MAKEWRHPQRAQIHGADFLKSTFETARQTRRRRSAGPPCLERVVTNLVIGAKRDQLQQAKAIAAHERDSRTAPPSLCCPRSREPRSSLALGGTTPRPRIPAQDGDYFAPSSRRIPATLSQPTISCGFPQRATDFSASALIAQHPPPSNSTGTTYLQSARLLARQPRVALHPHRSPRRRIAVMSARLSARSIYHIMIECWIIVRRCNEPGSHGSRDYAALQCEAADPTDFR